MSLLVQLDLDDPLLNMNLKQDIGFDFSSFVYLTPFLNMNLVQDILYRFQRLEHLN